MPSSLTSTCHAAVAPFRLGSDEVHVLYASVASEAQRVETHFEYLDEAERERAGRFHFAKDRDRFVVTRGLLRIILSRYLSLGPEALCFTYNSYGKPALSRDSSRHDIRFNTSHSGDLILFAVSSGREVGVDVEQVRDGLDVLGIARGCFSDGEAAALGSLATDARARGFFNCWTCKEAYIKARGQGLSLPLNQFEVSFAPDEPARLLSTAHDFDEAARWRLQRLSLGDGYAGAIAVEGAGWRARHYLWRRFNLWPTQPEKIEGLLSAPPRA